jgi:hypothetical protein
MFKWRTEKAKSRKEQLLEEAQKLRAGASLLSFGPVRDAALRQARQSEAAAYMDDWLNSPGLQPPKKDVAPDPLSPSYVEQAKRFRDKAAEAEQLIDLAQSEARRHALRQIADNYIRTADQLERLDSPGRGNRPLSWRLLSFCDRSLPD